VNQGSRQNRETFIEYLVGIVASGNEIKNQQGNKSKGETDFRLGHFGFLPGAIVDRVETVKEQGDIVVRCEAMGGGEGERGRQGGVRVYSD